MSAEGAMVVYGRGGDLGSFRAFADDLASTELSAIDPKRISLHSAERRDAFFALLFGSRLGYKLKALHIYSHAFGSGLALGYSDPALYQDRLRVAMRGRSSYLTTLQTEAGMIFTDDLIRSPYTHYRERIRSLFAPGAIVKIWGCNAAVPNWIYSDTDRNGVRITDLRSTADAPYYWRALHESNPVKPSIAQAFADYFQLDTYGATSGSSTQVRLGGKWVTATPKGLINIRGKLRYVQERDVMRLNPGKGGAYAVHHPR